MKKFLTLLTSLFAIAAITVSCEKDKKELPKSLAAAPATLEFTTDGGQQSFTVTAENVTWSVATTDSWISWEANPSNADEIIVTVGEYRGTALQSGTITVSAEGVDPVTVAVTQTGVAAMLGERTTLQRLNLHGKVKELSYYDYLPRDNKMTDLKFSDKGMLTDFVVTKNSAAVAVTVTYDAQNRISKIKALGGVDDFDIVITYGSHGKYVPTEEIFNDIATYDWSSFKDIAHTLWIPMLIKDISKITVTDRADSYNNMEFVYTITGNTGAIAFDGDNAYHTFTFEDNFVKTRTCYIWGSGDVVTTYTIDKTNGCILKSVSDDDVTFEFNNDNINSLKKLDSYWEGLYEYTYNSNLDVLTYALDGTLKTTRSYLYDDKGNWTSVTQNAGTPYVRTITYW